MNKSYQNFVQKPNSLLTLAQIWNSEIKTEKKLLNPRMSFLIPSK